MKSYTNQHKLYCGIDLHAKKSYKRRLKNVTA